jgi:1-acyl-sn-glycerol-3-phosphate acyltransferase
MGDEAFALEVEDRAGGKAQLLEPQEDPAAIALAVDDRLTTARTRPSGDLSASERRHLLRHELARFAAAARKLGPGWPDARDEELEAFASRVTGCLVAAFGPGPVRQLVMDTMNLDVWKGFWKVSSYLARSQAATARRRWQGGYEVDDYGLDWEFLNLLLPLARFLYQTYWRVDVLGIENVPAEGPALLVSNHSGVLPFDGAMISTAILTSTDPPRLPRALMADWFPTLPFVSILLQKTGQVLGSPLNTLRLLERGELVVVFPEGYKGVGKLYRDRYQLARFGRGGFIRMAVRTGVPIIPVAVVGAEEIYPMVGNVRPLARLLGMPFFPITPFFPWTGPLGVVPLPAKWTIQFGEPILVAEHGPRAATNPAVVTRLTEQVRSTIEGMLVAALAQRRSVFAG